MDTKKQAVGILDTIGDEAGKRVAKMFADMRDDITAAIDACVEDSQDSAEREKTPKHAVLTIPVSIKWDLDTRAVQVSLSVSIKRKATEDIVIEDPNQPGLPLVDGDGDAMPDGVGKAVAKIAKAIKNGGAKITVGDVIDAKEEIEAAHGLNEFKAKLADRVLASAGFADAEEIGGAKGGAR